MISHLILFIKASWAGKLAVACCAILPVSLVVAVWQIFENHADAWIQSLPVTIVAITGFIAMLRGQRNMHLAMNSRLDELIEAKRVASRLEGVQQERSEERARQASSVPSKPAETRGVN